MSSSGDALGGKRAIELKLAAARSRLILDKPFLGALVLRLPLRESTAHWCATTATDARALYYNPDFIAPLTHSQVQFVLAHEALHCGLSHFARRQYRNRQRWDVACDHAVNQLLLEDGLEPIQTALYNEAYAGMTAEEIYPLIPSDTDEQPQDEHLYDGPAEHDSGAGETQELSATSEATPRQQPGSDSVASPRQPPGDKHSEAARPLTPTQRDELNTQWQQRLAGAAQQAAQAGKMNGSVARLVERVLHSTVPWRTLLARYMSRSARIDYNIMRPSQRREGEAIQPSLHAWQTNVVVAVDTSGSIEADELNTFITEVNAIKGLVNARITLLACDRRLDDDCPWVFESWQRMIYPGTLQGSGGTDFNPVFDWLRTQGSPTDLLIYFTDAVGRFPQQRPAVDTLWIVKGAAPVPWGHRIQLN